MKKQMWYEDDRFLDLMKRKPRIKNFNRKFKNIKRGFDPIKNSNWLQPLEDLDNIVVTKPRASRVYMKDVLDILEKDEIIEIWNKKDSVNDISKYFNLNKNMIELIKDFSLEELKVILNKAM